MTIARGSDLLPRAHFGRHHKIVKLLAIGLLIGSSLAAFAQYRQQRALRAVLAPRNAATQIPLELESAAELGHIDRLVPQTMLMRPRGITLWQDPAPAVIFPGVEQLLLTSAVVTSQRSTWQNGQRTPYYVSALLYEDILDQPAGWYAGPFALRANATYLDHPDLEPVRCRPWAVEQGEPPLLEALHLGDGYRLECDIPIELATEHQPLPLELNLLIEYQAIRINDSAVRDELIQLQEKQGQFFDYPAHLLSTQAPIQQKLHLQRRSVSHSKYTLCLPAFANYTETVGKEVPLRYAEWRLYWSRLGVERVAWYAYEEEPQYAAFLNALIKTFPNKDEIIYVNKMNTPGYWDQALWTARCVIEYRSSSDYLIIMDLDEIMALNPREYKDPAASLSRWLESWPEDVGSYEMLRQDLSMGAEAFEKSTKSGKPHQSWLAQDLWTARTYDDQVLKDAYTKSIHRAEAVCDPWTHRQRVMYPLPEPGILDGAPMNMRDFTRFPYPNVDGMQFWRNVVWQEYNKKGLRDYSFLWPRVYHYRWWGGLPGERGSEPLPTHPHKVDFEISLRKQVEAVGRTLQKELQGSISSDATLPT